MIEYQKLITFKYNNQLFNLLIDNNGKYFFLKINNNSTYSYVTLKEYIEFVNIFCYKPNNIKLIENTKSNSKINIIPKIIIGGIVTTITLPLALTLGYKIRFEKMKRDYEKNHEYAILDTIDTEVQNHISFAIEDSKEELILDTIITSQYSDTVYIYDMDYLDNYLNYHITKDNLLTVLNENTNITDNFKILIKEYINSLYEKYPNIETRVFYENLKTLKIIECNKDELLFKTLSQDSLACYNKIENTIYTLSDYKYEKGTWEYQIIFHELTHVLRNGYFNKDGIKYKISGEGSSLALTTVDEALNSVFSVSLLGYEEKDIAYQLQSNYCTIMIECLDNYHLDDYINHSSSYYAKKLDEHNEDNNYAKTILNLIDIQYKDYHSDKIEIAQEEYYPIYDYISKMYYQKFITNNMSYQEATNIANELIEKVTFDVPKEYNIDKNRFYYCLDAYCNEIGIEITKNKFR